MNYTFAQKGIREVEIIQEGELLLTFNSHYIPVKHRDLVTTQFYIVETTKATIRVPGNVYWAVSSKTSDNIQWVETPSLCPNYSLILCHERVVCSDEHGEEKLWLYGLMSKKRSLLVTDEVYERVKKLVPDVPGEKRALGVWIDLGGVELPQKEDILEGGFNQRAAYLAGLFDSFALYSSYYVSFNDLTKPDLLVLRLICQSLGIRAQEVDSAHLVVEDTYNLDRVIRKYSSRWPLLCKETPPRNEMGYSPAPIIGIKKDTIETTYRLHTEKGYTLDGFYVF